MVNDTPPSAKDPQYIYIYGTNIISGKDLKKVINGITFVGMPAIIIAVTIITCRHNMEISVPSTHDLLLQLQDSDMLQYKI